MPAKIDPAAKYKNIPGLTEDVKAKLIHKDKVAAEGSALASMINTLRRDQTQPALKSAMEKIVGLSGMMDLDINETMAGCGFVPAPKSSKK